MSEQGEVLPDQGFGFLWEGVARLLHRVGGGVEPAGCRGGGTQTKRSHKMKNTLLALTVAGLMGALSIQAVAASASALDQDIYRAERPEKVETRKARKTGEEGEGRNHRRRATACPRRAA